MTKRLKEAIQILRELSDDEQDAAALAIFAYLSDDRREGGLSADEPPDIRAVLDQ